MTATSAMVATSPPTVTSLRNFDNVPPLEDGQGTELRACGHLLSALSARRPLGVGAEHAPGVAQGTDHHVEADAGALDRHQPCPGADLGTEGGHVGLRLD